MSRLRFDWPTILEQATAMGLPKTKQRGILREYVQARTLMHLFLHPLSTKLAFIGGTSLRMLHGFRRFSQNLDFDNLGASDEELDTLFAHVAKRLEEESLPCTYTMRVLQPGVGHGYLRFEGYAKETGITTDPREVVKVELDYTTPNLPREHEIVLMQRFDSVVEVQTNTLPVILLQKSAAFINRKDTKGRDIYDIAVLLQRGVLPNQAQAQRFEYQSTKVFLQTLLGKYASLTSSLAGLKTSLQPFLIQPEDIQYLDVFPTIVKTALKKVV